MDSLTNYRFGVIGAGRVGSVLAARLVAAGHAVCAVSARSDVSRRRAAELVPDVPVAEPAVVLDRCDVVVLAVPDDELIALAERLAGRVRRDQVCCHTSGRHGLDALESLTRSGARAIALHPAMTFAGTAADTSRSCVFGLTAREDDREFAEALTGALGGNPTWIAEEDRGLYHMALTHGANHLVTLLSQAMELLRNAGAADPAAVLRPLVTAALENTLANGDAALTGPVSRGDITTLRAHTDLVDGPGVDDDTATTYGAMARATSGRAEKTGMISSSTAEAVLDVLQEAGWNPAAGLTEEIR